MLSARPRRVPAPPVLQRDHRRPRVGRWHPRGRGPAGRRAPRHVHPAGRATPAGRAAAFPGPGPFPGRLARRQAPRPHGDRGQRCPRLGRGGGVCPRGGRGPACRDLPVLGVGPLRVPRGRRRPGRRGGRVRPGLRAEDHVDIDWRKLGSLLPTAGRGFVGVIRGERIESSYRRLLGNMTLGELPIPAYAPVWSVERNRLEYIGPRTDPDLSVARADPQGDRPSPLSSRRCSSTGAWCDGGLIESSAGRRCSSRRTLRLRVGPSTASTHRSSP